MSGRWAVTFTSDVGKPEAAVGEFTQSGDAVSGTFLAETGDHRFLAGQMQGDELYLSTFDGAHAFLYKAKVDSDGALAGDFWVGTAHHETLGRQARSERRVARCLFADIDAGRRQAFRFCIPGP